MNELELTPEIKGDFEYEIDEEGNMVITKINRIDSIDFTL